MADGNEDLRADDAPGPAYDSYEALELACPAERSGHVAVSDGRHMFVWGGYKSNQVRGLYDFYLPREELWIYNMETGRWRKINTEGDVPPSMSGSCAVCVDRVLYLFGGHHSRGNTNKFYMLDLRSTDRVLQWERIDCQGMPPSSKDKLGVWVYKNKLIFFGGYGYLPEDKVLGTFEFDETSFWNSSHPRGWNDHVHILDTETFIWSQPVTTVSPCRVLEPPSQPAQRREIGRRCEVDSSFLLFSGNSQTFHIFQGLHNSEKFNECIDQTSICYLTDVKWYCL